MVQLLSLLKTAETDITKITESDAVRLFGARAAALIPGFQLTAVMETTCDLHNWQLNFCQMA